MKKLLFTLIVLMTIQFANAQKTTPIWLLLQERLIPQPYLAEHFALNGKVKDAKLKMKGEMVDEWTFDTQGKLLKKTSYMYGMYQSSTEYDYSKKGEIAVQYSTGGKNIHQLF